MTLLRGLVPFTAILIAAVPLHAQTGASPTPQSAGEYRPWEENPHGREIGVVFISSSNCIVNRDPHFQPAVREMMRRLGVQRDSLRIGLSILGVTTDWKTRDGVAYLQQMGEFDEIATGRNWFNTTVLNYVFKDPDGALSIPQVILVERSVDAGPAGTQRFAVSPERVLARIVGGDQIMEWVSRGAPLPAGANPPPAR